MTRIPGSSLPRLNPESEVLHRRNGGIQFGWDPETAVVVHVASSVERRAILDLVRGLDGSRRLSEVYRRVGEAGLSEIRAARIVADLFDSGHLITESRTRTGTVRVHGNGPLADSIEAALTPTSLIVSRTRDIRSLSDVRRWSFDLVVLADTLVWDPALVQELLLAGLDHLVVRVRDGKGIVGPLVVPGVSSCLHCADPTRSGYDPEWPWLAAQLLGRNGTACPISLSATTAFAVAEISRHAHRRRNDPAAAIDTTIEIDTRRLEVGRRHWPIQPECSCQNLRNQPKRGGSAVS